MNKEKEKVKDIEEKMEEKDVQIDILKLLYYEMKDVLQKESEALQNDITEEFYQFLEDKIKNREVTNIGIIGEVSGSKSTSAISIFETENQIIEEEFKKKVPRFEHIFADQTEFLRFINIQEENVSIVIDEFSRIASTGLNSSTEAVMFDYYSDVFAQKYIHRISCSPSVVLDKNANVILNYIGKDEKKKISKFKLSYRNPSEGYREITLGYVIIDVSNVLDKDYYKKYRKKKFGRMSLLDKHGVRDIRELEFSGITLKVIDELTKLTKDGTKLSIDTILATASRVCREERKIYSELVKMEIASRCKNLLNYFTEMNRIRIKKLRAKTDEDKELLSEKWKIYENMRQKDLAEEHKRESIYKEYLNIKWTFYKYI